MSIPAKIEGAACALAGSIFTNRLCDGQDMPFVKAFLKDEPRCPDVPKATRCSRIIASGFSDEKAAMSFETSTRIDVGAG